MSKKPRLKKRKLCDILNYMDNVNLLIQVNQHFLDNTNKEIDEKESSIEYEGSAYDIPYKLAVECLAPKELIDGEEPIYLTTKEVTLKSGAKITRPLMVVDIINEEDYDLWLENRNA